MSRRVTIVLDDHLFEKLHETQAKQIMKTKASVSFSKVVSETLELGLKKKQ